MVDLPQKKVGIVACSGEELAEGTVTRLAALRVLEQLRPQVTATICLPSFWLAVKATALSLVFTPRLPSMAVTSAARRAPPKCILVNRQLAWL